jgi:opine dehydrogenase
VRVAVLGSGGGALAVSADLAHAGREVVLADLPEFAGNLDPVRQQGGVRVVAGLYGARIEPVAVAESVADAVDGSELVIVVVPCFGHEPFMRVLAPLLREGQSLLFFGEGSGSVVARLALAEAGQGIAIGETNTLPYLARPAGPGGVTADRKIGGVLLAGLPSSSTQRLLDLVSDVWPYISAAESVWETVLINFNAIDHVATMVANAGTAENRTGGMLLWGEGATPSVVRVIEAVDAELFAIRRALGLADERRYRDFLIAQGFAPDVGPGLYEVMRASKLVLGYAPTGADGLRTRYITEDVPYALVLAASIGDEVGEDTPVIDGLIAITSVMLGQDFRADGRTLDALGLAGSGADGLRRFAETGEVPLRGTDGAVRADSTA